MRIFIIGHKSPDLDAVSSAVEYAQFLEKAQIYKSAQIIPVAAEQVNKEAETILAQFNVKIPKVIGDYKIADEDRFILVDHNEESQRAQQVDNEKVLEIVDHHKINISFTSPLKIDVRPVGSTSTIIYELFEAKSIKPSKEIASLILAAILSDTQGLKSSTTTGIDSTIAHALSHELGLDLDKLTFEIFKAKSNITGLTAREIVKRDYKVFNFGGTKVLIGQVETVEPGEVLKQKEGLVKALEKIKVSEGVQQAYLVLTDILNINSQIVYATDAEREVIEKAFTTKGTNNIADCGPVMSRKKDIAPAIEKTLH